MILLNDFFTISKHDHLDNVITATLTLNAGHIVYEGHFPGMPVMPGVLMVQAILELMQFSLHKPMKLKDAGNIKFLSVIDPTQTPVVDVEIKFSATDDQYFVNAQLFAGAVIFFKLKATLTSA